MMGLWGVLFLLISSRGTFASDDWQVSPFPDPALKEWIRDYTFPEGLDRPITKIRDGNRTNALLIVQNGNIIFEEYQKGFGPDTPHIAWSVSKSIVGILTGIAVQEGLLQKETMVENYFPQVQGSGLQVQHLLHWASGFNWNEDYEYSPIHSRVILMLFSLGRSDMASFAASRGFSEAPGTRHSYSSGDTMVLSGVLKKVWQDDPDYPWTKLFNPLGMKHVTFEKDPAGTYIGSSYMYASARDLARIGWMLASNGVWRGKKILDPEWISWATQVAPSFQNAKQNIKDRWLFPGAQFWLNRKDPRSGLDRVWPQVPEGAFFAKGHWGQMLAVFPSEGLVIVRFADDRLHKVDWNLFFGKILEGLRKGTKP